MWYKDFLYDCALFELFFISFSYRLVAGIPLMSKLALNNQKHFSCEYIEEIDADA